MTPTRMAADLAAAIKAQNPVHNFHARVARGS